MSYKIIVLGGSGYIGRNLTINLSRSVSNSSITSFNSKQLNLLNQNSCNSLDDIIDENTIIFFCSGIKKQIGDNLTTYLQNLTMLTNFLKLNKIKLCKKIIYLSSAEVYGENINRLDIRESLALKPSSFYGLAKKNSEELLIMTLVKLNYKNFIIARMPLVYGPNETQNIYGPSGFTKNALLNRVQTLWGDGTEKRNFLFIDDLVNVLIHLMNSNFSGTINIANSASNSFKDIIKALKENKIDLKIDQKTRTKDKVDQGYDISLLQEIFPEYTPHSLGQGVNKILRFQEES